MDNLSLSAGSQDYLRDVKKAIQAVKRDKWRDAENIMRKMMRSWRKDRWMEYAISSFLRHAGEVGWEEDDDKKHEKLAVIILERLESAFKAGYPSLDGEKILRKGTMNQKIANELLKVAKSLTASDYEMNMKLRQIATKH